MGTSRDPVLSFMEGHHPRAGTAGLRRAFLGRLKPQPRGRQVAGMDHPRPLVAGLLSKSRAGLGIGGRRLSG